MKEHVVDMARKLVDGGYRTPLLIAVVLVLVCKLKTDAVHRKEMRQEGISKYRPYGIPSYTELTSRRTEALQSKCKWGKFPVQAPVRIGGRGHFCNNSVTFPGKSWGALLKQRAPPSWVIRCGWGAPATNRPCSKSEVPRRHTRRAGETHPVPTADGKPEAPEGVPAKAYSGSRRRGPFKRCTAHQELR